MVDPASSPPDPGATRWLRIGLGLALALWLGAGLLQYLAGPTTSTLPYSRFREAVEAGKVKDVTVAGRLISGHTTDGGSFDTVPVTDPGLLDALRSKGVVVTGIADSSSSWPWILGALLGGGLFLWVVGRNQPAGGLSAAAAISRSRARIYVEKEVKITFADVAGCDEAKEELKEVVSFLKEPERYRKLGGRVPKGVLLVGPPGTGKTLLARAVAGEAGVPFFSISGSEFVEIFVGVGAARVRDLFAQARARAPAIVFLDELDALGKTRGPALPGAHEEREQTLNQLLVELDGFDPRSGVILLAATNRPEILDPALLRSGRFDRHVSVDRPDRPGRLAILTLHAQGVPLAADVDLAAIAAMTPGMVGADLAMVVNEAALLAARHRREQVGMADLTEAVERVIAGLEKRSRVLTPEERKRVATHELGHALVAIALDGAEKVRKISIIPRGVAALGYTIQSPREDRFLLTKSELEARIATLLGGRAAEELVYGEVSTGAADDLLRATEVAKAMVEEHGMGRNLGLASFRSPGGGEAFLRAGPDRGARVAEEIDEEVRWILEQQHARALRALAARRPLLTAAREELLKRETLSAEELEGVAARVSGANGHGDATEGRA